MEAVHSIGLTASVRQVLFWRRANHHHKLNANILVVGEMLVQRIRGSFHSKDVSGHLALLFFVACVAVNQGSFMSPCR